jgi:adenosylcobyric acid synthase
MGVPTVNTENEATSPFVVESRSGVAADSPDGALDDEGLTLGTYMHGLFHNRAIRRSVLEYAARRRGVSLPRLGDDIDPDAEYDKLAALVREHLDLEHVRRAMDLTRPG